MWIIATLLSHKVDKKEQCKWKDDYRFRLARTSSLVLGGHRWSLVGRPREIVELIFYWSFLAPNEFLGEFWGRFCTVREAIKQYNKTTTAFLTL
jgi:hypothetical protein